MSQSVCKEVLRCGACGSLYLHPLPDAEEIVSCYEGHGHSGWMTLHAKGYYRGMQLGWRLKKWKAHGRMLDLGCAIGSVMEGVHAASGWETVGIELSPVAVQYGTKRGLDVHGGFIHGNSLPAGSIDYVVAHNVIEHDPRPDKVFAEVSRLLRPGGRLDIIVPYGPTDIYPTLRLAREGLRVMPVYAGHVNFFTPKGIEHIAGGAGFTTVRRRAYHFVPMLKMRFLWPGSSRRWRKRLVVPDLAGGPPPPDELVGVLRNPGGWLAWRYQISLRYKRLSYHPLPSLGHSNAYLFQKS
jgi:SAM-dependent methyltransferase